MTGDLAFIHDINGWLIENSIDMNLTILLINNNGGNIFNRIYKKNLKEDELKTISYAKRNKLAKTRRGLSSQL